MSETETVTAEVIAVRKAPVGGKLLALVDVVIAIHGIEFKVRGLRVSRDNGWQSRDICHLSTASGY